MANRRIERLPEPKWDAEALPFRPLVNAGTCCTLREGFIRFMLLFLDFYKQYANHLLRCKLVRWGLEWNLNWAPDTGLADSAAAGGPGFNIDPCSVPPCPGGVVCLVSNWLCMQTLQDMLSASQQDLEAFLTQLYRAIAGAAPLKDKVRPILTMSIILSCTRLCGFVMVPCTC